VIPETPLSSRDPAAEAEFEAQVRLNLRRNYVAHLCHGLLGQTGMRLINAPTFIPAYVSALAGYDAAAGIARGLQYLGMFLSPILGATVIEHRRRVLPVGLFIGAMMRVQILGLALGGLLLPDPWPLITAWVFLGLFGCFLGVQGVVFSFLVSKVIPVDKRGVLMGLRNALAGLTAAGVAVVAGNTLIETDALGNGYAATFLVAFGFTTCGLLVLLFIREPETPQVREASPVAQRLRELPALLRSDRAFTRYFVARAMATMGRMGMPFYVLYAGTRVEISGTRLGGLTAAFVLSQSATNLLWGMLADRRGFRVVFLLSLWLWMVAVLLLLQADTFALLLAVFAAVGAGFGGWQMSAQQLVLEFGSRRNLPMRIAIANSASDLVGAFGAVLGGVLTLVVPYAALFWLATAFQIGALVIVTFFVEEPRHRG
jgi:MFS family permease